VTATLLDGKTTRDEIYADLQTRVQALTAAGHTPGLGTVLVGDDPGSHAYVRGKHADCAKVGITSLRRDLPADVSQTQLLNTVDELNANPDCTGYIVQLPLPKHLDEVATLEQMDSLKDADGLHPRHCRAATPLRGADCRRQGRSHRTWGHRWASARTAAHPPLRECDGYLVPHRDP